MTAVEVAVPNLKEKSPSGVALYAPAASSVIPQFSKSFSTPFRSCQVRQTACIYKGEDME